MHRKKILAVAVAGALGMGSAGVAVAAEAAAGNYTIYGKLYPQVSSYDYSGTTLNDPGNSLVGAISASGDHGQRTTIDVANSRIGFRGSEGLGGGLSAIFQIETRVRFDNGTGLWAGGRDSFLGLTGAYGTFKLGNMDTAYKSVGDKMSFLGISSGNFVSNSNVLARGPGDIDFHLRQTNAIMYESPKFADVQLLVTWGKDEFKGNPGRGINMLLNSYGVTWERGPLYLALGHEIHHDFFEGSRSFDNVTNTPTATTATNGSVRSNDTATRVTAMYKIGETTLSLDVSQIELKETGATTGGFTGYKNKRYALGAEQRFGNITGAVSVVNSDKGTCTVTGGACDSSGLEGRQMNIGGMYNFSRRTQVYAIYSKLTNGRLADYNNVAINPSAGTAPQAGEDITAIGVGVSHSF